MLRDTVEEKRVLDLFRMYRYQKMKLVMNVHCQAGKNYAFSAQNYLSSVSLVKSDLEENCELYLDAHKHQPKIEVTETGSWLDIRFDVTGIEEQEIDHVLQSLLRNDAFIH